MIRAATFALALLSSPASAQFVAEPEGYRMDDYRAPIPARLEGARVVDPVEAHVLWKEDAAAFVDVLPRAPKPEGLPEGTIWNEPPRRSIPGATWLPNVGYGALAEVTETYLRDGLEAATGGDVTRPVVFFCLDECWMSWNAARRAMGLGYRTVIWFPEGTDGWAFYDYPVEALEPHPGEP